MAVITISRQFGAGGRTLGEMLAKELGYTFLDDLIIHELALKADVTADVIKSTEKELGSRLSRLITTMISSNYIERVIGEGKGYVDEKKYFDLLHDVIIKFAQQDNVILLGRGGQYILNEYKTARHIFLIADIDYRVKFMQQFYDMTPSKAEKAVRQGEDRRKKFFKRFGRENYDNPCHYHLTMNMSMISMDQAVQQIKALIQ